MNIDEKLIIDNLMEITNLLDSLNIKWFLFGGGLLGIYRDNKLIPWDNDLDIAVLAEELEKHFDYIIENLQQNGFSLYKSNKSFKNIKIAFKKNDFEYELDGFYSSKSYRMRRLWKYPGHYFEKNQYILFKESKISTPYPIEDFLKLTYGCDWKTPIKPKLHEKYTDYINLWC